MLKNIPFWIITTLFLVFVFNQFNLETEPNTISYSEFVSQIEQFQVDKVTFEGNTVYGKSKSGMSFKVILPSVPDMKLMDTLFEYQVEVAAQQIQPPSLFKQLVVATLPILIVIGLLMFLMRSQMPGGGGKGGPLGFARSKAKRFAPENNKITFADVAGVDEAKEEVQEIVEFLSAPQKFAKLGGQVPKGMLMVGSPGTGKTLLAKAIAGEAGVPFFSISGSDFVEMFVGVGASRVRDMFAQARKDMPCILFIDEIDAVGRHRGAGMGGGHDEREQTLNQLLVEMDGFNATDGIIIIAATNRPDVLDPALLRPGRFDRQVVVSLPDIKGRTQILEVHMRGKTTSPDVNAETIARGTPGFSGADLANLVNEAAIIASRNSLAAIGMLQFELAKDKIMMGAERRSMIMTDDEKRSTAYHEAGHAIVGLLSPEHDPVYKVTIIPRGRALGVTMFLPERDQHSYSKRAINSKIKTMFGGRIAEELILGADGITTGASNDIQKATEMARNMVVKWGLSDMGPICYDHGSDEVFLGKSMAHNGDNHIAPETAAKIDLEVKKIMNSCYEHAEEILRDNMDKLHAMAAALVEFETIEEKHISKLMAGEKLTKADFDDHNSTSNSAQADAETSAQNTSEENASADASSKTSKDKDTAVVDGENSAV